MRANRRLIAFVLALATLLTFNVMVIAQSSVQNTEQKIVRQYNLGEGYQAMEVVRGGQKYILVKFPDRFQSFPKDCSYALFAEGMVTAVLKVYGSNAFLTGVPQIEVEQTDAGAAFFADTSRGDRVQIVVMVDSLESRLPIGVQLATVALPPERKF